MPNTANGLVIHGTPSGDAGTALDANFTLLDTWKTDADGDLASLAAHAASTANPHSVTKDQVGLASVTDDAQLTIANNLSDLDDAGDARLNLGLGSAAELSETAAQFNANKIQDVDVSNASPAEDDVLTFDGSQWIPQAGGAGTVTSVTVTAPTEITVTDPTVTGSGTIALTWSTQTANNFLAAPDGSDGPLTMRNIVAADVPGYAELQASFPLANTHGEIQAALDAMPRASGVMTGVQTGDPKIGGTLHLPPGEIDIEDNPIYLHSGQNLVGHSDGSTLIRYNGSGFAIRLKTWGDHGIHGRSRISGFTLVSEADGVGFDLTDTGTTPNERFGATGEAHDVNIENMLFNCNGVSIDLDNGALGYFHRIRNVKVTGYLNRIIKLGGTTGYAVGFEINGLLFTGNSYRTLVVGTDQLGTLDDDGGASTIILPTGASAVDDFYNGMDVQLYRSAGGVGWTDRRLITDYVGSTRTATVETAWTTSPTDFTPDTGDNFYIYLNHQSSLIYIRGDGLISSSSIEGQISGLPCLELVDSQVTWIMGGGHFETHSDQTGSRTALLLDNSNLMLDWTQFLQPWIKWVIDATSTLVVWGITRPTDNGGNVLDHDTWYTALDVADGGKVWTRETIATQAALMAQSFN